MFKYLIVVPVILIVCLFILIRYGVNPPPIFSIDPVFIGERVRLVNWYSDTIIEVEDINNRTQRPLAYDYASQSMVEFKAEIPTYVFSNLEKIWFNAVSGTAILAPNNKYILYQSHDQVCCCCESYTTTQNAWVIANLATRQRTILQYFHIGRVQWLNDSSGFFVTWWGDYGGSGGISYVEVSNFDNPLKGNWIYSYLNSLNLIEAISPDQRYFLVSDQINRSGLYLWDINSMTGKTILSNDYVAGAAIDPYDADIIYVILEEGLTKYNLRTGKREVMHPELNTHLISYAEFSPDLSHLIFISGCKIFDAPLNDTYIYPRGLDLACPFYG